MQRLGDSDLKVWLRWFALSKWRSTMIVNGFLKFIFSREAYFCISCVNMVKQCDERPISTLHYCSRRLGSCTRHLTLVLREPITFRSIGFKLFVKTAYLLFLDHDQFHMFHIALFRCSFHLDFGWCTFIRRLVAFAWARSSLAVPRRRKMLLGVSWISPKRRRLCTVP